MPYFSNARNVDIHESALTEVQGDVHNYSAGGSMSIQHGDPLLQVLYPSTATGASYNSREREPPPKCQPGTREAILENVTSWIENGKGIAGSGSGSIMWVHGPAGAGKSAIAQTICESSASRGQLAASFFFSRETVIRRKIDSFIATLAFQLAISGTHMLRSQITKAVQENPLIVHEATASQAGHLIIRPYQSLPNDTWSYLPYLIVIDGLDECSGNDKQTLLLGILLDLVQIHRLSLYILLVSRPEPHIRHLFDTAEVRANRFRVLSLYGDHQAHLDVFSFLREGFNRIHDAERHSAVMRTVRKPWPLDSVIARIVDKSGGYFIYASTILKFVDEEYFSPLERLQEVVDNSSSSSSLSFAELDKLYAQILMTSPKRGLLKRILGCIFLSFKSSGGAMTSSITSIALRLNVQSSEVTLSLRGLHSLLSISSLPTSLGGLHGSWDNRGDQYVTSLHASLGDFLFDQERAGIFYIDAQEHYKDVAVTCWNCLSRPFDKTKDNYTFSQQKSLEILPNISNGHVKNFLDCFIFHWTRILDKRQVLDSLRNTRLSTWRPLIRSSGGWDIEEQLMLSTTVHVVIATLEALASQPVDLIEELRCIANAINFSHLSPLSMHDIRLIQGIWTMFIDQVHPMRGYEDFLQLSKSPKRDHAVKYLTFMRYRFNLWENRISVLLGVSIPFCKRPSFCEFMSDPRRSGILFASPETRHAYLALCCIKDMTRSKSYLQIDHTHHNIVGRRKDEEDYARMFFRVHLSHASPSAVDEVQAYLRSFDPTAIPSSDLDLAEWDRYAIIRIRLNIQEILEWLEGLSEPPIDIISSWKPIHARLIRLRFIGE